LQASACCDKTSLTGAEESVAGETFVASANEATGYVGAIRLGVTGTHHLIRAFIEICATMQRCVRGAKYMKFISFRSQLQMFRMDEQERHTRNSYKRNFNQNVSTFAV